MTDTIVVTGAAGFAGSHLLDLLEGCGARVVAWKRPDDRYPAGRDGSELPWTSLDLLDRAAVAAEVARARPAVVYHMAGAAHVGRSWDRTRETLEVNVLGTWHLIAAVRDAGLAPRVLVPGSAMVYRPAGRPLVEDDPVGPESPYGLSKLAQERLGVRAVAESGVPVLLTRSFNHVGPRQDPSFFAASFARQVARIEAGLQDPVITVGNLDARRDLTDVRDAVRAYRVIAERGTPGRIYNVSSGRAFAIGDVLEGLLTHARVPIAVRVDPALLRPSDTPTVIGDHARLTGELGWRPEIPIDRTLGDLVAFWRGAVATAAA